MKYKYVKELMTSPAITCEENTTIKETIKIMKEKNIGFLPITKNKFIVGVITDRDILLRSSGVYKLNTKINKIMTNGTIHFVHPSTTLYDAAKIMADYKVRRLVVLDDGNVVGIITSKSLLNNYELLTYISQTYLPNNTLPDYEMYANSNPHDSIKTSDFPL